MVAQISPSTTVTQQPSVVQRVIGAATSPVTAPDAASTRITTEPSHRFDVRAALRNAGIGAAIGGALGGVSLIGRIGLPLIGKVASLSGVARVGMLGAAAGVGIAAAPVVLPHVRRFVAKHPAAKAALVGAGIGGAASLVLPLIPAPLGAIVGAGIGLAIHALRNRPDHQRGSHDRDGYTAYPGYVAVGRIPLGEVASRSTRTPSTTTSLGMTPTTSSTSTGAPVATTATKPKTTTPASSTQNAALTAQVEAQRQALERQIVGQVAAAGLPAAGLTSVVTPPGMVTATSPAVTAGAVPVLTGIAPGGNPVLPTRPGA